MLLSWMLGVFFCTSLNSATATLNNLFVYSAALKYLAYFVLQAEVAERQSIRADL